MKTKTFKVLAMTGICLGLATACKTTQGWQREQEVDIQETNIVFPDELMKLKGFKIKKAMIREDGSYRQEAVYFTGGFFSYGRYFRGGMVEVNNHTFSTRLQKYYANLEIVGDIQKTNAAIGDIYYATLQGKDQTCVVMSGNYGTFMLIRGGNGYPGQTNGAYCERGKVAGLSDKALKWIRRIKLR